MKERQLLIVFGLLQMAGMVWSQDAATAEQHFTKLYRKNLERLIKMIRNETEACEDFFEHACGNFRNVVASDEEGETPNVPPFLYNKQDRFEFFEESKEYFGSEMGKVLKDLYESCKTRPKGHLEELKRWRAMLQQIDFLKEDMGTYRFWPFLRFQWDQMRRKEGFVVTWSSLAGRMAAHGLMAFLRIYFAKDTIYISPVESIVCPSLEEFRRSLLPVMQKRNLQIADIISYELWQFCRELRGEISSSRETGTAENYLLDEKTTEYFQVFFHSLGLKQGAVKSARKLPLDLQRINEILGVLNTTDDRIVFNYLLWFAFEQMSVPDCFALMEEFEDLLFSEYWQWYAFDPYFSRNVAMATYLFHTTRFQKKRKEVLMSENWDKFLYKKLEKKDFNIERNIQQYGNTFLHPQVLEESFNSSAFQKRVFYKNLLTLKRQKMHHSFSSSYVDKDDINHPAYFMRSFLQFSIILLKQPLFFYYASEGFDLWSSAKILYDSDGYYTALDCLERQSFLYADQNDILDTLSSAKVAEVFRFYLAFEEILEDYQFWLEGESFAFAEDFVLEYFDLNSYQILFYSKAQMFCSRNDPYYSQIINRAFMNMPQFQGAFNCSADASMNPPMKCMGKTLD